MIYEILLCARESNPVKKNILFNSKLMKFLYIPLTLNNKQLFSQQQFFKNNLTVVLIQM